MAEQQLMIPERIKVGFQNRTGTYTGKLAYVIYYDQKGVLRKEKSWQSWRDHKIDDVEFENIPTEGFVLNKGVGGARQSYGWNARNEYIRVYDPRDFEFEISVANLLFILREGDCSRGKGLEGKFVYSWDGTELVLLPECSSDYQNSKKYTQLQTCGVKAKDLIPGATYITKKQRTCVYLGRFDYYSVVGKDYYYYYKKKNVKGVEKLHIFWDGKLFVAMSDLKSIAVLQSDVIAPNFAELVDMYIRSPHGSRAFKLFLKEVEPQENDYYANVFFFQEGDAYIECHPDHYPGGKSRYIYLRYKVTLQDGIVHADSDQRVCSAYGSLNLGHTLHPWVEPTKQRLFVGLESGSVYRLWNCELHEETNNGEED